MFKKLFGLLNAFTGLRSGEASLPQVKPLAGKLGPVTSPRKRRILDLRAPLHSHIGPGPFSRSKTQAREDRMGRQARWRMHREQAQARALLAKTNKIAGVSPS